MKLTKRFAAVLLALCLSLSVSVVSFAKIATKTDTTTAASDANWTETKVVTETEKTLNEKLKVMEKVFDAKAFKALKDKDITAYCKTMGVETKNVKIANQKTNLTKACESKLKELVTVTKIKADKKLTLTF